MNKKLEQKGKTQTKITVIQLYQPITHAKQNNQHRSNST